MKRLKFAILPMSFLLAACGGSGDEVVFDTTLGPETERQIEALPSTLEGDSANARYSSEQLKGANMESSDGSGGAGN